MTGKRDIRRELLSLEFQHDITVTVLVERLKKFLDDYKALGIRYHSTHIQRIEDVLKDYNELLEKIGELNNVYEADGSERKCEADASTGGPIGLGENVLFPPIGVWDNR